MSTTGSFIVGELLGVIVLLTGILLELARRK